MTPVFNPYKVLGVAAGANSADIKAQYAKLTRWLQSAAEAGSLGAQAQLEQVQSAYDFLTDGKRRYQYDKDHPASDNALGFQLKMTPSKQMIESLDEPQVIYLLLELIPDVPGDESAQRDTGINLTLVLDHSTSMNKGRRLDRVKVAAAEIINQLSTSDILSVVGFNDRAEVVIPATAVTDKRRLVSKARMMRASGSTEIYHGLLTGIQENRKNLDPKRVNHLILLTDGNTYGDEERSVELARQVSREGIGISTLGLGTEWNDEFLDKLAATTGGTSGYIKSAQSVVSFMNNQVKRLSNVFAERMQMSFAADVGIDVELVFKLAPSPQPLTHTEPIQPLGSVQINRSVQALLQLQIPANIPVGPLTIGRFVASGDIMVTGEPYILVEEITLQVTDQTVQEDPPNNIIDALGKLTLYRMQERANDAITRGDPQEATRQLENLGTRLLDIGQEELAQEAFDEARRIANTQIISEEGKKTLKYQTRMLINPDADEDPASGTVILSDSEDEDQDPGGTLMLSNDE